MKNTMIKIISLALSLVLVLSVMATPLFAMGEGRLEAAQNLPQSEPAPEEQEQIPPEPEDTQEGTDPPLMIEGAEPFLTIPIGGQAADGEPATGGGRRSLLVSVVYPKGKDAAKPLKKGDEITLVFSLQNYETFTGTFEQNKVPVEVGIGAYELALTYNGAFDVMGVTSNFTSSTTPKLANLSYNENAGATLDTLRIVALFSEKVSGRVQALNAAALAKTSGQFVSVKLKLAQDLADGAGIMNIGVDGVMAITKDGNVDEQSFTGGGELTQEVGYDTAAPIITAKNSNSENEADRDTPLNIITTQTHVVDPGAKIGITDDNVVSYTVKKGTANYTTADTNSSDYAVEFTLTEPGVYTVTATDTAGNTATGKVTVTPRVTAISVALKGTVDVGGVQQAYIGTSFTATPTLSPAIATLPVGDKVVEWVLTNPEGINPDFITATGTTLSGPVVDDTTQVWTQTTAAPVTFAVQGYQGQYALTARSVAKDPQNLSQARAASAPMVMASPAKINSVTIKAAKPSISSGDTPESVEITGVITAQGRVVEDGETPTADDFAQVGCAVTALSANENLATVGDITFSPAAAGKSAYAYAVTLIAEQDARGICDVTVSCGGIAAQAAVNISNYGVNYTKMGLTASSTGLDYQKNHSATLYINLTDAKNSSDTIAVYPEDCEFTSDNTNLLAVDILKDGATVLVREGAQYLTAATKVTVTAALKNDPQGRKATFAFTVYPTERADWIEIYEVTASPNMTVSYGNTQLYTDNLAEQAQLNVRVLGQQTDGAGGETVITPVNKGLVKFTSSNAKVAAVSDTGLITFKGYGESIITVTATDGSGSSAQIKVLVNKAIEQLLSASPTVVMIPPGGKQQFKITGTVPADATNSKLTGITWEVVSGFTQHFTLNTKTGLVTASKDAPDGVHLYIKAVVPNLELQEDPLELVNMPMEQQFVVFVQQSDPNQLKAFTALNPKTIEAEKDKPFTVSVANAAFTANPQWTLDWADGTMIYKSGASFTFTPDRTGKGTLYASYGGKTLTASVIIYDPALPKAAKLSLAVEDGSNDYTLYDRYTTTQLILKATNGTNVENVDYNNTIFTSSHPGLVSVNDDGSLAVNTEAVALTVTKDTKVTITAQVKNDPYARKVTKVITVTNKILADSVGRLNFYNESVQSENTNTDFTVDMSTLTNTSFATALSIDRRSMGTAFCQSKDVEAIYTLPGGERFLLGSNEYEQAFAALTFSSSNTKVATVDKFGVVTIKGAGTAVIKAEQLKGTYDAKTQTPAVATRTIVVTESTTALTLSHSAYTVVAGGTKPVTLSLKATTTPKTAVVTWESDDQAVATVDATGKVTIAAGLTAGDEANITARSGGLEATCTIKVTAAGLTVAGAQKLTAADKKLTLGTDKLLYFTLSSAASIEDVAIGVSNPDVFSVGEVKDASQYDTAALRGYMVPIVPNGPGSGTITIAVSGKTYSETFSVYKYDLSGTALTLTPSHGLLLDEWSARPENENAQSLAVILTDKTKNTLAEVDAEELVFTSSNPVLLPIKPDGTYHLRNLNTITKLTTVTVIATMMGETGARSGKITFKVSPTTSAASKVTITHRSDADDFIQNMILVGDTELSKVIYTDVGDTAAQTVFSLGAKIDRTNDTSVMLAESKQITWKSSDTKVATVDANGTVTAKAKGTAVITATAKDGSEISDRLTLRVNHSSVVTNGLPMVDGAAWVELLGGGSYTIPYKLAPINGDIIIAGYEVQSGGDYITVDAKKGIVKAAKVTAEQTAVVTVKLATNKVYTPHGSGEEQLNDGDAVLDDINLTLRILPAATIKTFALYDSAAPTKTVTKLDIPLDTPYTLIMKGTGTDNAPILDFGQVLYAAERTMATVNMIDGLDISRDEHELTLTPTAPGTYKLTASLGGKAVTCTVNVLYTMPSTSGDKPFAAKDKLEGAVILRAGGAQLPLAKLCAGDAMYEVGTYVGIRAAGWGSDWTYNEDIISFKSSSPLVKVATDGKVTVAPYIPKETKVTITATMKNDPAKHTVSIPITVTSQNLTREMMLYRGTTPIEAEDTVTLLADKTSLRLSTVCKTIDGYTADNTAVTWKSSNTKVATVDKNGVVKLTGKGTTVITAVAADGGGAQTGFTLVLT